MATKVGEVQVTMTANVKKNEEIWTALRFNYTDKAKEGSFKPSEDLAANDKIKITIEKI
jgi:hypothetical protein